jgi:hypothetical protein
MRGARIALVYAKRIMKSYTMEGLRFVFRQSLLGAAEVTWRWVFAITAWLLLCFLVIEYLGSLPVTRGDMLLLRSGVPVLVFETIKRILVSGSERLALALIVVITGATVLWICAACVGRAATLRAILEYFQPQNFPGPSRPRPASLAGIHFLRAALLMASILAWIGSALLAGLASSKSDPRPGLVVLFCLALWSVVALVWSTLDGLLSIAPIFAMRDREDTFGSISAATEFVVAHGVEVGRTRALFAVIHLAAFLVATSIASVPMPLARFLPPSITAAGVLLLTLAYFAVVDFLRVAKLAAYVCILEAPDESYHSPVVTYQPRTPNPLHASHRDEDDILSDIPGLVPPPEPA